MLFLHVCLVIRIRLYDQSKQLINVLYIITKVCIDCFDLAWFSCLSSEHLCVFCSWCYIYLKIVAYLPLLS